MTARSPTAYVTSATMHLAIVALIVLSAYLLRQRQETPTVFEVVAGVGDNYEAREAPAAGSTAPSTPTIKVDIPEPPRPVVRQVEPEPSPITPAPVVVPAPTPNTAPTPKVVEPKPPNFVNDVTRLARKREANILKKYEQEQARIAAAEAKRKAAEEKKKEAEAKRMTIDEFNRLHAKKPAAAAKAPAPSTIKTKKIDTEGIAGGVTGGTTRQAGAGGTALAVENRDLTRAYIAMILQRIRDSVTQAGISDLFEVSVQFTVSQWGTLSNATIVESSGHSEFDRAVLDAFRTIGQLRPPPTKQTETFRVTLRMRE